MRSERVTAELQGHALAPSIPCCSSAVAMSRSFSAIRWLPSGEAWLPILHESHGEWRFTALYSNAQQAHALDKTGHWVVIYFHTDSSPEGQCKVVTETRGDLKSRRVVRGRENECAALYARAWRSA
jgi:hypothetical protein